MKIGLVLAGGGAKGSYQVGVWRALRELDIEQYIQIVSGTSIGALNAILFLQGDIQKAENLWTNISPDKILPTDNLDLIKRGVLITLGMKNMNFVKKYMPRMLEQGNISRQGLSEILDNYIDIKQVKDIEKICYATCTEVPTLKARYFKLNEYDEEIFRQILMATSALPMIYECEEIENRKYLDGGMIDNTPIQPVYGENCDIIIVVSLSKESSIDRSKFPNSKIIQIKPSEMEEGVLTGTLNFEADNIKKRIQQGYDDTINLLEPIFQIAKAQINQQYELISMEGCNSVDVKNIKIDNFSNKLSRYFREKFTKSTKNIKTNDKNINI